MDKCFAALHYPVHNKLTGERLTNFSNSSIQTIMIVHPFSTTHPALDRLALSVEFFVDIAAAIRAHVGLSALAGRFMGAIHRHNQARLEALAARDWRVQAELRAMATRDL